MRRGILRLGKYILLLLLLLCFGYILSLNAQIGRQDTPVIYYTGEASFSDELANAMREEEESEADKTLSWTAVMTVSSQNFSNESLKRKAAGTLLLINGSSANLVSSSGELMADDLTGCILSTEAAWELFGETEISGGEISCNQVSYEVRGVYEDTETVVILPAKTYLASENLSGKSAMADEEELSGEDGSGETDDILFDKIAVTSAESLSIAQRSEAIETFETQYGVGDDKTDCLIYRRIAEAFAMVIPVMALICIAVPGIINLIKMRRKIVRCIIGCAVLAAVIVMFFFLFQIRPSISADLIPNTWSDFDFWKDKLTEFSASTEHLLFSEKSEAELGYFKPLVRMGAFTGIGIILFVLTALSFRAEKLRGNTAGDKEGTMFNGTALAGRYKVKTELRDLVIFLIITCIVEFITLFLLCRWEISPDDKRMLIYLWPYFLAGRYTVIMMRSF